MQHEDKNEVKKKRKNNYNFRLNQQTSRFKYQ